MTQKASQGRKAFSKGSAENSRGLVGLPAPRVSEQVCVSRLQESELLRVKAFLLFGKLANVVRVSKRHFFKEEVRKAWVPLMLHCQDPCSEAAQVRRALVFAPPSLGPAVPKRNAFSGPAGSAACGLPFMLEVGAARSSGGDPGSLCDPHFSSWPRPSCSDVLNGSGER